MNDPMWYRVRGSIISDGVRNFFGKMKRDGFPKISPDRWKNYYPNEWNGSEMHQWMEEARIQCWSSENRPRSSKAIESMIRHLVQMTNFNHYDGRRNHLDAILMMRIAAIESGMMDESAADAYFDMNFPG